MKEEIAKMYAQALYDDLPPNVFADQVLRLFDVSGSFTMQDLMLYYQDKKGLDFNSKVVEVLNCMVNDR